MSLDPRTSLKDCWCKASVGTVPSLITSKNSAIIFIGALFAVSAVIYEQRVVPEVIAVVGMGILWISMLPGIVYLYAGKLAPVPILPATGLYYAAFFGLNVFAIPLAWKDASSIVLYNLVDLGDIQPEVLLFVFFGISVFVAAFYFFRYVIFKQFLRFYLPEATQHINYSPLLWDLMIAHLLYEYVPAIATIPSLGQLLGPVGYLAFGGLFLLWRRRQLSKIEAIVLVLIILPLEIYWRIRILFITDIVLFLVFFTFLFWRERMFKILSMCGAIIFILLLVYGASTAMRSTSVSGPEKLLETGKAFISLMLFNKTEVTINEDAITKFLGRFGSLTKRTGQLWVFHVVDNKTPNQVPYWKGKSYRPLFTSFVPRLIYPDKPEERAGGEFGRNYGFLLLEDFHTSINIPWITELLVNFGRSGVIWGMAIFGLFLAFLDRVFNSGDSTDLEFVFGLTLIFPLVYPESNFSVMTGSMLPLFVSLYIYFAGGAWLLSKYSLFQRTN